LATEKESWSSRVTARDKEREEKPRTKRRQNQLPTHSKREKKTQKIKKTRKKSKPLNHNTTARKKKSAHKKKVGEKP